jgi:hypothetical protein
MEKIQKEFWAMPEAELAVLPEEGLFLILRPKQPGEEEKARSHTFFEKTDWHSMFKKVFEDDFDDASLSQWQKHISPDYENDVTVQEGLMKVSANNNTYAYLSRELPDDTAMLEYRCNYGSDMAVSWAPGVVLAWDDCDFRVIINYPGHGRLAYDYGGHEVIHGFIGLGSAKWFDVRLVLQEGKVLIMVSRDGGKYYKTMTEVALPRKDSPKRILMGKMGLGKRDSDYQAPGDKVEAFFEDIKIYVK